jgi:CxxC motif-containing protein (DUF1111 family)
MNRKSLVSFVIILGFLASGKYFVGCKKSSGGALMAEPSEEYSGGMKGTSFDFSENAFGKSIAGISNADQDAFVVGNSFFRNNWVQAPASASARDGLGLVFNAASCGGCHGKDGRAAPPSSPFDALNGLLFRLSITGQDANGGPLAEPVYGGQLNNLAIPGVTAEGTVSVSYVEIPGTYPDGTSYSLRKPDYEFVNLGYGNFHPAVAFSPRIANQVMGLGLIEAIPERSILALVDESDQDNDGVSGRANYVWNKALNATSLGRFGWKANQPSLLQQTAGAFLGDIGITSPLFTKENLSSEQERLYGSLPNGGSPEIDQDDLDRVVRYMQLLAVPGRRDVHDPTVLRGKQLFFQANCNGCHAPVFTTESSTDVLNNQKIRPYSDFLLHDMGASLADGRKDYLADGNEWRTPPLWGIGLLKTVNGHNFLLHDGRARSFEEAILWHQGEASASVETFKNYSAADRNALLLFLESL